MRRKWRASASTIGIRIRNGNWLRKSLKIFLQELPSKCLLRAERWEEGEGFISSPCGFMNPRPWNEESFWESFCMLSCAIYFLGSSVTLYLLEKIHYQRRWCLVSNIRQQSESPWNNGNSLSLHVNLFYKAHRSSLPMDISQLQAPNICLKCEEKLDAWEKKRFLKLRLATVIWSDLHNACIFLDNSCSSS